MNEMCKYCARTAKPRSENGIASGCYNMHCRNVIYNAWNLIFLDQNLYSNSQSLACWIERLIKRLNRRKLKIQNANIVVDPTVVWKLREGVKNRDEQKITQSFRVSICKSHRLQQTSYYVMESHVCWKICAATCYSAGLSSFAPLWTKQNIWINFDLSYGLTEFATALSGCSCRLVNNAESVDGGINRFKQKWMMCVFRCARI